MTTPRRSATLTNQLGSASDGRAGRSNAFASSLCRPRTESQRGQAPRGRQGSEERRNASHKPMLGETGGDVKFARRGEQTSMDATCALEDNGRRGRRRELGRFACSSSTTTCPSSPRSPSSSTASRSCTSPARCLTGLRRRAGRGGGARRGRHRPAHAAPRRRQHGRAPAPRPAEPLPHRHHRRRGACAPPGRQGGRRRRRPAKQELVEALISRLRATLAAAHAG